MFISFSKTIARLGGFRLGFGMRLNKKNAWWLALIILFVAIIKLTLYAMVLCGWMMYAMIYGIYWCIKKIIQVSKKRDTHTSLSNATHDFVQDTTHDTSMSALSNDIPEIALKHSQIENTKEVQIVNFQASPSPNKNLKRKILNIITSVIRWCIGAFFALLA